MRLKKIITFYRAKIFIHSNWNNVFHSKKTWTFGNFGEVCKTQDREGGENYRRNKPTKSLHSQNQQWENDAFTNEVHNHVVEGLVDIGASMLIITTYVVNELGLMHQVTINEK